MCWRTQWAAVERPVQSSPAPLDVRMGEGEEDSPLGPDQLGPHSDWTIHSLLQPHNPRPLIFSMRPWVCHYIFSWVKLGNVLCIGQLPFPRSRREMYAWKGLGREGGHCIGGEVRKAIMGIKGELFLGGGISDYFNLIPHAFLFSILPIFLSWRYIPFLIRQKMSFILNERRN